MMAVHQLVGGVLSIAGGVFLVLASVGLVRMPDVYNRMQAGTKATTLGSILFLLGIGVAFPHWLGRIVLLILFIAFTNPLSSHALIRAAHAVGIPLAPGTVKDDLVAAAADTAAADTAAAAEKQTEAEAEPGEHERTTGDTP